LNIFQGLVGAVFEGIGVSIGSYLGGQSMQNFGSSKTFEYFAYGAFAAFIIHVILQYLMNKCLGPFGKKSSADESAGKSIEALDTKTKVDKISEDGFKEIDLTN
jgi:hypothetical protein